MAGIIMEIILLYNNNTTMVGYICNSRFYFCTILLMVHSLVLSTEKNQTQIHLAHFRATSRWSHEPGSHLFLMLQSPKLKESEWESYLCKMEAEVKGIHSSQRTEEETSLLKLRWFPAIGTWRFQHTGLIMGYTGNNWLQFFKCRTGSNTQQRDASIRRKELFLLWQRALPVIKFDTRKN